MNFLSLFTESPVTALVFLLAVVIAVTVHESAHAWVAVRLGDETPRLQGRVSLNPLAHLDPVGSIAFLLLGFGWGKPVIYNPMRLSRHVDELLIALAGPASNLLCALLINIIVRLIEPFAPVYSQFLVLTSDINVLLAAFNIIPIPPLDGSSIVAYFWPEYRSLIGGQIGMIILLAIILFSFSGLGSILGAVIMPIEAAFSSLTHLFGLL